MMMMKRAKYLTLNIKTGQKQDTKTACLIIVLSVTALAEG